MMTPEDQYRICVDGLSDFAAGIGATDVVLGLSGGIDSSLVACMCVDAFGADHVHGYMLPGPYSSEHSLVDAQELGRNLGLHVERISIVEPPIARRSPGWPPRIRRRAAAWWSSWRFPTRTAG